MKKNLLFVSCTVALMCGALIYQNSRHVRDENFVVSPKDTQTQVPAFSSLPPLEDPKVSLARMEKERQEAIERENNPQLPDGVAEVGPGLKRMKRGSQVEVAPQLLASWEGGNRAKNAIFSPDDKWLLIGSEYNEIYQTSDWKLSRPVGGSGIADFSPNGKLVAASASSGVGIWRFSDGEPLRILKDKSGIVEKAGVWGPVAFSPDGRRLVTLGEDPNTKWTPDGGDSSVAITEAAFNRQIAMKVWDVSSGKRLKVIVGPWRSAYGQETPVAWVRTSTHRKGNFEPRSFHEGDGICQLPDRTLGVRIVWQGYLSVEDLTTKQLIRNIPYGDKITAAALSPDGTLVASGGDGRNSSGESKLGMVKIWRVADGKLLAKFEGKSGGTSAIAFSRDGKKLVVVGRRESSSGGIVSVYAL